MSARAYYCTDLDDLWTKYSGLWTQIGQLPQQKWNGGGSRFLRILVRVDQRQKQTSFAVSATGVVRSLKYRANSDLLLKVTHLLAY
jgi:hypothetical protein